MKTIVNVMFAVISALLFLECMAVEAKPKIMSEEDLSCYFESIEQCGTNLVLTARCKFVYMFNAKNPSEHKFSKAGEKIVLPEGSELVVAERHSSLRFSSARGVDGRKEFRVRSRVNDLFQGPLTGSAYLISDDEKTESSGRKKGSAAPEGGRAMSKSAGAPEKGAEKKCLKGLRLLPCED